MNCIVRGGVTVLGLGCSLQLLAYQQMNNSQKVSLPLEDLDLRLIHGSSVAVAGILCNACDVA